MSTLYIFYIFNVTLLCIVISGRAISYQEFARNSANDNHVCSDSEVVFNHALPVNTGNNRCLWSCIKDTACISVFSNKESGRCIGCKSTYFSTDTLVEDSGMKYFVLKSKFYGQKCYPGDVCIGANETCWSDTCICQIGYSYDYKTHTCVDYCASYGTSFQMYPGYRITAYNLNTFSESSEWECQQECRLEPTCRSIEFQIITSKCHISFETALSKPESTDAHENYNFYTRNCEG